jgi:hypothetical protein
LAFRTINCFGREAHEVHQGITELVDVMIKKSYDSPTETYGLNDHLTGRESAGKPTNTLKQVFIPP